MLIVSNCIVHLLAAQTLSQIKYEVIFPAGNASKFVECCLSLDHSQVMMIVKTSDWSMAA
jgi:hypothetical protein